MRSNVQFSLCIEVLRVSKVIRTILVIFISIRPHSFFNSCSANRTDSQLSCAFHTEGYVTTRYENHIWCCAETNLQESKHKKGFTKPQISQKHCTNQFLTLGHLFDTWRKYSSKHFPFFSQVFFYRFQNDCEKTKTKQEISPSVPKENWLKSAWHQILQNFFAKHLYLAEFLLFQLPQCFL